MDAWLQFLTGEFALGGITLQNWMPIILAIFLVWIGLNRAINN